jgi:hypothetical protein
MGPMEPMNSRALEYDPLDDFDVLLIAAREAFPDFDVFHAGHGYLAVTAGSTVYMAGSVDALVDKLRHHRED